jgi:type IV pilus assembly protein PilM
VAGRVAVGLDIGTSGVRAAELSLGRGGALTHFGQVALPPGAVVGGEVVDEAAVAAAIRRLWKEAGFKSKKVALGVANQKVVVRQVDLVWMEQKELKSALAYQVQDYIPMPVEQTVLDYHAIEEFTSEDGARMLRVLLVAAARDMVSSVLRATSRAGLEATTVDLTSFALIRAACRGGELGLDSNATALVDVGARVTNIVVHQNGVPRFVRILLMGGGDITDAVAERLGVPPEQAEAAKQQLFSDAGQREAHPAARAVDASVNSLVEEVRGSLDYYRAAAGSVPISRLLLTGGGSRLGDLQQRLSAATRLAVEVANPIAGLNVDKTGLSMEQLRYVEPLSAVSIGLALGVAS